MTFIREFQNHALFIALALTAVLGAILLSMLIAYLVSLYRHALEDAYVRRNQIRWQELVKRLFEGTLRYTDVKLTRRERPWIRELLIDAFFRQEFECSWDADKQRDAFAELKIQPSCEERVRAIYLALGFLSRDMRELKSRRWWRRVKAIERLEDMGFVEAEDALLRLLSDKRSEVRFAALKALAALGSKRFYAQVGEIFASSSSWSYLYLVNILYYARLPVEVLAPLARSDNPYLRKAAATLLGRKGETKSVSLLAKLAGDEVQEVRREAIASLARTGSAAAIPVFWRRLKDESPQVRAAIARGIGELDQLVFLQKLASDEEFDVRFQAFAVLSRMGILGKEAIRNYKGKYKDLALEFLNLESQEGESHA